MKRGKSVSGLMRTATEFEMLAAEEISELQKLSDVKEIVSKVKEAYTNYGYAYGIRYALNEFGCLQMPGGKENEKENN